MTELRDDLIASKDNRIAVHFYFVEPTANNNTGLLTHCQHYAYCDLTGLVKLILSVSNDS